MFRPVWSSVPSSSTSPLWRLKSRTSFIGGRIVGYFTVDITTKPSRRVITNRAGPTTSRSSVARVSGTGKRSVIGLIAVTVKGGSAIGSPWSGVKVTCTVLPSGSLEKPRPVSAICSRTWKVTSWPTWAKGDVAKPSSLTL